MAVIAELVRDLCVVSDKEEWLVRVDPAMAYKVMYEMFQSVGRVIL